MLTLITGTPGAGKSLYAVSDVMQAYAGQTITLEDGTERKRRLLCDGFKNLLLDHEPLVSPKEDHTGAITADEGCSIVNWWEWCQPGDVICLDEIQRFWRSRGLGSKVPRMIAELETHRHRGVDFVLITQHPMLLDQNVRRLVSRHVHLRRMWAGSHAVRYEWDHCSSPERVGDAGKSYWRYPKHAYKLYKSAEVHTKQGGRPPAALFILGLAALALPAVAWYGVSHVQGMLHPAEPAKKAADKLGAPKTGNASAQLPAATAPAAAGPATFAAAVLPDKQTPPQLLGCIATVNRCQCFDDAGKTALVDRQHCETGSTQVGFVLAAKNVPRVDLGRSPPTLTDGPPSEQQVAAARVPAARTVENSDGSVLKSMREARAAASAPRY